MVFGDQQLWVQVETFREDKAKQKEKLCRVTPEPTSRQPIESSWTPFLGRR